MVLALAAVVACIPASGGARQLVTVEASSARSTTAVVRAWRRDGACWRPALGPWRAWVGVNGLSRSHREGDGTTPLGTFAAGPVAYGVAPDPGTRLAYHRLVGGDWWDEDPGSPTYNSFRHLACGAAPSFGGTSERLWRQTRAYAHFLPIEYNTHPAVPGRGSAIFIHDELGHATNGCVSLAPAALAELLRWLSPAASPVVSIRLRAA
jgi:L,D-peptidoglycan transpeptidase YkuD (ErfK/YbiS/YcfS/YnhG family)